MTPEQLAEIEARANAATECDRWVFKDGELLMVDGGARWTVQCYSKVPMPDMVAQFRNPADGEFAAHARADIPALLAEVRRLRWLETTARALAERAQNIKPFTTFSLIDRRPLLECPFCGSGIVNGGKGHDEGCEWAEFAEAVRAMEGRGDADRSRV